MASEGAGSGRIVLVGRHGAVPDVRPDAEAHPPRREPAEEARPLWLPAAEDRAPQPAPEQALPSQPDAEEAGPPRRPDAAPRLRRRAVHESHPPPRPERQSGWTTKRLTLGAAMGAAATIAGALLFVTRFGALGGETSPLLAIGFGLFAIGMIVFCACLIALLGIGIGTLAARRGWSAAALALLAPLALLWGLWAVAALVYAVPAVLSLILIAALLVALK
jgi:hypothetical protein